jgi:hypothetical protein
VFNNADDVMPDPLPDEGGDVVIDMLSGVLVDPDDGTGLGEPGADRAEDVGAEVPPEAPPPVVAPPQPWDDITPPSALGYCYLRGRQICRIQRKDFEGRLWLNCYQHTSCRVNLPLVGGPSDADIFRFLFEVPPSAEVADPAERKRRATEHMAIARGRWGIRGRG